MLDPLEYSSHQQQIASIAPDNQCLEPTAGLMPPVGPFDKTLEPPRATALLTPPSVVAQRTTIASSRRAQRRPHHPTPQDTVRALASWHPPAPRPCTAMRSV